MEEDDAPVSTQQVFGVQLSMNPSGSLLPSTWTHALAGLELPIAFVALALIIRHQCYFPSIHLLLFSLVTDRCTGLLYSHLSYGSWVAGLLDHGHEIDAFGMR